MGGIPPEIQGWVAATILAIQIWQGRLIIDMTRKLASLETLITKEVVK